MAQFTQWLFLTAFILFILFMVVKTFFYKSVAQKEEKNSAVMKLTLQDIKRHLKSKFFHLKTKCFDLKWKN